MYNPDTDLLFPARILPALGDMRAATWRELVNCVIVAGAEIFHSAKEETEQYMRKKAASYHGETPDNLNEKKR
jgi:hypothetical protein